MNKKNKSLPMFKNVKEESRFWDTHDITDFLMSDKPIEISYEPKLEKKTLITLRIAPILKKRLEKIAKSYDISTSSLIRMWIVEKVKNYSS